MFTAKYSYIACMFVQLKCFWSVSTFTYFTLIHKFDEASKGNFKSPKTMDKYHKVS